MLLNGGLPNIYSILYFAVFFPMRGLFHASWQTLILVTWANAAALTSLYRFANLAWNGLFCFDMYKSLRCDCVLRSNQYLSVSVCSSVLLLVPVCVCVCVCVCNRLLAEHAVCVLCVLVVGLQAHCCSSTNVVTVKVPLDTKWTAAALCLRQ